MVIKHFSMMNCWTLFGRNCRIADNNRLYHRNSLTGIYMIQHKYLVFSITNIVFKQFASIEIILTPPLDRYPTREIPRISHVLGQKSFYYQNPESPRISQSQFLRIHKFSEPVTGCLARNLYFQRVDMFC